MNFQKPLGVFFGILFFQSALCQAPADTTQANQLQEVIVTGTRTARNVATLPLPTQVITAQTIQKSGLSRLNEIIQEQTGLITVPDFGGGEGIQMQGLDAAYVMILIDGQPLFGRSAGTLDLSRISVNNIERIEVVKGASSSLYGSEALAGVVNIITIKPSIDEKLKASINYKLATFNTHDVSTGLAFGGKKIAVESFGNYFKTDGYNLSESDVVQTVAPYYNFTVQAKMKLVASEKASVLVNTRIFAQDQEYNAIVEDAIYSGQSRTREWNHSILVNQTVTEKLKITYDLYATHYTAHEYLNDRNNQLFDESKFNQWFYRPEVRSHFKIGAHTLSAGLGLNYETLNRTYFDKQEMLNSEYIFGQFEWFLKEKINILAGFRYDNHRQYQSQLSPKVGVNYKWNDHFSIKTSIGYGYKAPDLRQLYFDFTNSSVGYTVLGYRVAEDKLAALQSQGQILFTNGFSFSNPLKPESSLNINWGGHYKKSQWVFDYNFFYNTIKNLIDTRAIAQRTNGQNVFSYFNVDQIFTYGVELNGSYQINPGFAISSGYQYLIAKDETVVKKIEQGEVFARDPKTLSAFKLQPNDYFGLFNRSKHTANLKVSYLIPYLKTDVSARVLYRSRYGILDSNNNNILDQYDHFVRGYFLTNLTFNKEFESKIAAQIGINNLLDYKDEANIPNIAGRQVFLRMQYQF